MSDRYATIPTITTNERGHKMTQPKLSPRLEEIRIAQQARYAEQREAFANRELLNTLNRANQTLNNLYLLTKEEN